MPTRLILALAVLCLFGAMRGSEMSGAAVAQASEQIGGPEADINCPDFLSPRDAQAVYEAAGGPGADTYDLDGEGEQENGLACDDEHNEFKGSATCANFREQSHAQALLEAASGNPYDLDPNEDRQACSPDATSTPVPTSTPGPTLGDRTCSADRPQIKTSLHDVCAGSHATVIQPGYGTVSVTLPRSITITPAFAVPGTLGARQSASGSTTGDGVTGKQEVTSAKQALKERKKARRARLRAELRAARGDQ